MKIWKLLGHRVYIHKQCIYFICIIKITVLNVDILLLFYIVVVYSSYAYNSILCVRTAASRCANCALYKGTLTKEREERQIKS